MAKSLSHYLSPDGTLYKGDVLPVFSWKTQPYQWDETGKILLGSYKEEYLCKSQPTDVSNNVTFSVSNSSFKNMKDILFSDMGAWKHNGSPLKYFVVGKSSGNNDLKSSATKDPGCYILKRIYYQNISSPDLRKIVATISGISYYTYYFSVNPFGKFKGNDVFFVTYVTIVGKYVF